MHQNLDPKPSPGPKPVPDPHPDPKPGPGIFTTIIYRNDISRINNIYQIQTYIKI